MLRTFNCGIGMVVVVAETEATQIRNILESGGEKVSILGRMEQRGGDAVVFDGALGL